MISIKRKLFDNTQADSFVTRLRKRRLEKFWDLIRDLPRPVRVIDVGGTAAFWESCGISQGEDLVITLVNLEGKVSSDCDYLVRAGDARNLESIGENEYDVAFSNSVIEHVGDFDDQLAMAREVRRVAPRYYVQTPNYYFPIEPHFLFPGFQWLPVSWRVFLISHFRLGYMKEIYSKEDARDVVAHTVLMTRRQLESAFPGGQIAAERILGMVKSYVVHSPVVRS